MSLPWASFAPLTNEPHQLIETHLVLKNTVYCGVTNWLSYFMVGETESFLFFCLTLYNKNIHYSKNFYKGTRQNNSFGDIIVDFSRKCSQTVHNYNFFHPSQQFSCSMFIVGSDLEKTAGQRSLANAFLLHSLWSDSWWKIWSPHIQLLCPSGLTFTNAIAPMGQEDHTDEERGSEGGKQHTQDNEDWRPHWHIKPPCQEDKRECLGLGSWKICGPWKDGSCYSTPAVLLSWGNDSRCHQIILAF